MKTIAIKPIAPKATADDWVRHRGPELDREAVPHPAVVPVPHPAVAPAEPMKRFTLDVSESLHKRIKTQCATRGQKMADAIREIFEREFPTT